MSVSLSHSPPPPPPPPPPTLSLSLGYVFSIEMATMDTISLTPLMKVAPKIYTRVQLEVNSHSQESAKLSCYLLPLFLTPALPHLALSSLELAPVQKIPLRAIELDFNRRTCCLGLITCVVNKWKVFIPQTHGGTRACISLISCLPRLFYSAKKRAKGQDSH